MRSLLHTRFLWLVLPALLMALGLGLPACTPDEDPQGEESNPEAAKEAANYWKSTCVTCHGPEGKGDGPGAAALDPKPRDFNSPEWQASVTDGHIQKVILLGGQAVGLSSQMTPNPVLNDKPEVVRELRKIVRSFGKKEQEGGGG